MGSFYNTDASVLEKDSRQVLKDVLYYLWFSKLSITFQSQLPNGDEHYNYQVGDNELYKISVFDKPGK